MVYTVLWACGMQAKSICIYHELMIRANKIYIIIGSAPAMQAM